MIDKKSALALLTASAMLFSAGASGATREGFIAAAGAAKAGNDGLRPRCIPA